MSARTAARQLFRYELDLVGEQEVRCEKWDTARLHFCYRKGNENHQKKTLFLYTTQQYQQLRE
jgi:hypothetical protein